MTYNQLQKGIWYP